MLAHAAVELDTEVQKRCSSLLSLDHQLGLGTVLSYRFHDGGCKVWLDAKMHPMVMYSPAATLALIIFPSSFPPSSASATAR